MEPTHAAGGGHRSSIVEAGLVESLCLLFDGFALAPIYLAPGVDIHVSLLLPPSNHLTYTWQHTTQHRPY